MILIDTPRWPAHGTHFAHLVSDDSLAELFAFAAQTGLHPRAFDHDHYDVAERRFDQLVAHGALPVESTELVRRLRGSGLRVRTTARTPKRSAAERLLAAQWQQLMPGQQRLGADLIERWSEPHRHYHDVRHLLQANQALDELGLPVALDRPVRLAAWFHDIVYAGRPGLDEAASAELAEHLLDGVVSANEVAEVARLVRLTAGHDPEPGDQAGEALCDADLSVLALPPGRYFCYVRDVRLDYAHVPNEDFRVGRLRVLDELLARESLFRTPRGQQDWTPEATRNLMDERELIASMLGAFALPPAT